VVISQYIFVSIVVIPVRALINDSLLKIVGANNNKSSTTFCYGFSTKIQQSKSTWIGLMTYSAAYRDHNESNQFKNSLRLDSVISSLNLAYELSDTNLS